MEFCAELNNIWVPSQDNPLVSAKAQEQVSHHNQLHTEG